MCPESLWPGCSVIYSISRIRGPGVKSWGWERLLSDYPSGSLTEFLLHVPDTLDYTGTETLVPKGGMLPLVGTLVLPLGWKLSQPAGHAEVLVPMSQQAMTDLP